MEHVLKNALTLASLNRNNLSRSWSEECDFMLNGFYRKSGNRFRPGLWTRTKSGGTVAVHESVFTTERARRTAVNDGEVRAWLKLRLYSPELKAVLAGSSRGRPVKKGEFFHHPKAWKEAECSRNLKAR